MLAAACGIGREHSRVPDLTCSCGIYGAADIKTVAGYLGAGSPVLGLTYGSGRVIPRQHTFRAEHARIVAILAVAEAFTLPRDELRRIPDAYSVPLLLDEHGTQPEDRRKAVIAGRVVGLPDKIDREYRALVENEWPPPQLTRANGPRGQEPN
ncbi:MAG TPA: hypothetical protein VLW50_23980 [Streptosporangiaceae bacterium]|nr:hypothetical protein [Streptosporangiaceae bacterium]